MDLLREQAEFESYLTRIKFDRLNFMDARANSIRLSIKRTPFVTMWQGKILRFPPKKFSAAIPKQNLTPHIACVNLQSWANSTFQRRNSWFMSKISYFGETLKSGLRVLWISNSSAASRISRLTLRNLWALRGYNFIFWQNFKKLFASAQN